VREGVVSYGLSSYGYDIRVADEFKVFTNINSTVVDPKNFDAARSSDVKATSASFRRTRSRWPKTVEYFRIPRDVLTGLRRQVDLRALRADRQRDAVRARVGRASSRSRSRTRRRCRPRSTPTKGISQVLFFRATRSCEVVVRDKKGKYQKQQGLTLPRL
jgi:dCTP deaminase